MNESPETPEEVGTGDVVKLSKPESGEESARFVVTEWNGDRGFVRLICNLPIPPVELVSASDVVVIEKAK